MAGEAGMMAGGFSHGGNLVQAAREAGISAQDILDFSANVNPEGLPAGAVARLAREACDPRLLLQYPDTDAAELKRALRERTGIPEECIVIGAGADSLIHAAVRAVAPARCILPVPAFSEYERACIASRCEIHRVRLLASDGFRLPMRAFAVLRAGDLVILNNPHNPTGTCTSRDEMKLRIDCCRAAGASVLVDEAFIDYAPDSAITREAASTEGVIAIRSLTKFYGCPGLRVGYAVAAPETVRKLRVQISAWPVTVFAANALAEAVCDEDYARDALARNEQARADLAESLCGLGCTVFPAAANFLFVELPASSGALDVRARLLCEHGILVRECDSFDGLERNRYLRVAVRRSRENEQLVDALASVLNQTT
jgi:threonine-phosphate decarboxylase